MSKNFNPEEYEKVVQEFRNSINSLDPFEKRRESLKTPLEKLTNYKVLVEDSVFWASRQDYLELLKSFLSKKTDGETFTSQFIELRTRNIRSTKELCGMIEDEIRPIPDLYYTFKASGFNSAINELFLEIDRYDPDIHNDDQSDWNNIIYSESQLRSVIQKNFVPTLQESCDLNDSFFIN